jgi:hypothetical protein
MSQAYMSRRVVKHTTFTQSQTIINNFRGMGGHTPKEDVIYYYIYEFMAKGGI